jgi:hypothetical protein
MIGTFRPAPHPSRRRVLDPGFLGTRDRAVLELLHRADVATTAQLVTLVYRRRQTAQEHLVALYRAGWIERAVLPPTTRGGAPLAFRLSARARRRLGLGPLTRGRAGTQLRHSLNVTETVATLVRMKPDGSESLPVRAWLPERAAARVGLRDVFPDSIVALALPTGSGVLCLEIDQATEHAPVIRAKLARYEPALRSRHGWGVLFVVESPVRAAYLARVGRDADCAFRLIGKAWVTVLADLAAEGPGATIREITPGGGRTTLAAVLRDPRARRCSTPVGSDAWIELLAFGGAEDTAEALA